MCKKYSVQCPAACGVEVPREKVWFFVCSPVMPLIYLVFKNHEENVKLNWLHFSNLCLLESCLGPPKCQS